MFTIVVLWQTPWDHVSRYPDGGECVNVSLASLDQSLEMLGLPEGGLIVLGVELCEDVEPVPL